jgi:hypothetical protein
MKGPIVYTATDFAAPRVRGMLAGLGYEVRRLETSTLLGMLDVCRRRVVGSLAGPGQRDAEILANAEHALEGLVADAGSWLELSARELGWDRARGRESRRAA